VFGLANRGGPCLLLGTVGSTRRILAISQQSRPRRRASHRVESSLQRGERALYDCCQIRTLLVRSARCRLNALVSGGDSGFKLGIFLLEGFSGGFKVGVCGDGLTYRFPGMLRHGAPTG
jgi:hypothetical protein